MKRAEGSTAGKQSLGHSQDGPRDLGSRGWATLLIVDNAKRLAFVRAGKHREHEISANRRVDPGCAQNDMGGQGRPHGAFARLLALAIDRKRIDGVILDIGALFSPIEDVVGREMDQRNVEMRTGGRGGRSTVAVDGEGGSLFAFGQVDRGKRGGIDDEVWTQLADCGLRRFRLAKIDGLASVAEDLDAGGP